jgi:hypothetical protein
MKAVKKNILVIVILLFISIKIHAQTLNYDTCTSLQQFAGEWMYANGQDTIRIFLKPHRSYNQHFNYTSDRLWGWHEYKKGNIIVESNYQARFNSIPYVNDKLGNNFNSIHIAPGRNCNFVKLTGSIWDLTERDEFHIVTATISDNSTVMSWTMRHREGYGIGTGRTGMTLPQNFVLIKQ